MAGVAKRARAKVGGLERYRDMYSSLEKDFEAAIEQFGLPFELCESQPRELRRSGPWECRNGGSSLSRGWVSPACVQCHTGERMESFFISLRCPNDCYFCFNSNQEEYEHYVKNKRDVAREVRERFEDGAQYDFLAITGGEPLLHPNELIDAIKQMRSCYPLSHIRLYTSGACADENILERVFAAGLDEIRFSIKLEGGVGAYERITELIAFSATRITTMVEMPVPPDSVGRMKEIMKDLDDVGVAGINLLEFCFPLGNAAEFARRGYAIRKRPYQVPYDYWYAGGLPIAGSEAAILELLEWAESANLRMGAHYCSLDNKHSGQFFKQNQTWLANPKLRGIFDFCEFDPVDCCLKSAKAFGGALGDLAKFLKGQGVPFRWGEVEWDGHVICFLEFPSSQLESVRRRFGGMEYGTCSYVVERIDEEYVLRELGITKS